MDIVKANVHKSPAYTKTIYVEAMRDSNGMVMNGKNIETPKIFVDRQARGTRLHHRAIRPP